MTPQAERLGGQLAALGALALLVAVFTLDPTPAVSPDAIPRAARGLAGALVWVLAATGLGGAILGSSSLAGALFLGTGVLGLGLFGLAWVGLFSGPALGGVAVAASCGWLLRPKIELPKLDAAGWAVVLVCGAPALINALAPPTDTDEIYQHLAIPAQLLHVRGLLGGLLHPDASRPIPVHTLYAAAMSFGGEPAPKLLHLLWAAVGLNHLRGLGDRWLGAPAGGAAALTLLGSYTFARELGLAYNNLPAAWWSLLAVEAAVAGRRKELAAYAGMALACKYTAAPVVVAAYLITWRSLGLRAVPTMAALTAGALAWVAPYWARNASEGLHPFFPYAGWPEAEGIVFTYNERYGLGRDWASMLLLPWNMVVHAETTSYKFLGQVSPAGLLAIPGMALAAWHRPATRPVLAAAAVAFVGWALGPHWLRYLLPAAPILGLAVGAAAVALPSWGRAVLVIGGVLGLPASWGPWLGPTAEEAAVVVGATPRETLLKERVPGWGAIEYINKYTESDARVALLFSWPGYYVERPYVLGSVEDHVPARHLLLTQGDAALTTLRALGVTHAVVGEVRFLKKTYPFLDDERFRREFTEPEAALGELLLKEGTVVFEEGRYAVWRFPDGDR